ncbi:hypothetical protein GCM10028824_39650 [Hymenobacter segetis]|uniref:T9SS type A sorting domain-containing protein n=1 Tax=Hymenobacter segetis TaxID=2025509 RepID=A0ABU9LT57_9BACT
MKILRHCYLLVAFFYAAGLGASRAQVATVATPLDPAITNLADDTRSMTDAAGNTYVAGSYANGPVQLGGTLLPAPAASGRNGFLAKVGPTGVVQWAIGGISQQTVGVQTLTLDRLGNAYVAFKVDSVAGLSSSFAFGSRTTPIAGNLLAKVTPAGAVASLVYLQRRTIYPLSEITALAADSAGNCYLSTVDDGGRYFGSFRFPGTAGTTCALIVRRSSSGGFALVRSMGATAGTSGSAYLRLNDLQLGANGDLYCEGELDGTLLLNTTPVVSISGNGNFVARLSTAGGGRWGVLSSTHLASLATESKHVKIAVSPTGAVYVAGVTINSNFTYGGLPVGLGGYVVKISKNGTPQWARATETVPDYVRVETTRNATRIALDAAGNVYRLGVLGLPSAMFGTITLPHPIAGTGATPPVAFYLVSYDSTGTVRWARTANAVPAPATPAAYAQWGAGLGVDQNFNVYLLANPTGGGQLQVDNQPLGTGYTVVRLEQAARVSGTFYLDQNNNGQRDAGEIPFPYPQVVADAAQSRAFSSTAGTGEYSFFGPAGAAYRLTVPSPHSSYTLSAAAVRTGTLPAVGYPVTGLDFGLVPVANQADVRATLTPYGTARPGFTTRYRLTVENVGTTTVAGGTATLTLDSRMAYISSTPSAGRAGQVLTWTYGTLAPFARLEYDVLFSLPTNTPAGTVLSTAAAAPLTADVMPADNTAALAQTVLAAYDPNHIEVNYDRLTPAQVTAQQPLDYTIHFQNLGTAAASTVVLSDTLDFRKLNLASLMLVAQSHSCIWSLATAGPDKGLLTVRFPNINLPERNADVIRSMGFVRFRVQPRSTLTVGEIIPNHAGIVFDYNAPVITNVATTTVFQATAALARHDAPAWTAYPNPATDAVSINADLATAGKVAIELLDVLGRPLRRQLLTAPAGPLHQLVDLHGLAAGVYLLRLTPPTGPATSRRVVLR